MQKRLISLNMLQYNNQTVPQFCAHASLIAYRSDSSIKIKTFAKDVRESEIKLIKQKQKQVNKWFFTVQSDKLILLIEYNHKNNENVELYEVEVAANQIKNKLLCKLTNAQNCVGLKNCIAYIQDQTVVKTHTLHNNSSSTLCQCTRNSKIIAHEGNDIFVLSPSEKEASDQKILRVFNYNRSQLSYQQSPLNIDYIKNPLEIYKDKYVFQQTNANKEIQIYNINESKIIGKFNFQGDLLQAKIRDDILLLITSKENMDKYYIYALNHEQSILSHRSVYQKGKGMYFQSYCCPAEIAEQIVEGKSAIYRQADRILGRGEPVLLIYIQPIKKTKVQLTKIMSTQIKQQKFRENEMNTIILSKIQNKQKGGNQKKQKAQKQSLEIEKTRVNLSMNHRKSQNEKSIEEMQKKIIDHIVDIKIKGLMDKFQELEKRLIRIQDQISFIYKRIQKSIENINREEIKKNVQNLFQKVTPQFQSYFKEVFRQISGVMDQGVTYYSTKLARQSQIHREAFNQIINMTFDAAQEIAELGRKQLQHSEKTAQNIEKLLQIRKKWEIQTKEATQNFKSSKNSVEANINLSSVPLSPDKKGTQQNNTKKKN